MIKLAAPALVLALLTGCTATPDTEAQRPPSPSPSSSLGSARVIAEDLDAPWSIAFHGDIPLLSERDTGNILELDADGTARVVGAVDDATPRGEGGLLGIAVHSEYLYAYFTAGDENRIARFALTGEPGSLALGPVEVLLDGMPAASYHNGGRIAFGPDGMLYATAGDAGDTSTAQDIAVLAGKILRMTPEGTVPTDNPFAGSLVYSFGHRNAQGLAWDAGGTMYASEFGQNTWDELNVIEAGGNYGWPEVEGIAGDGEYIDPVQQWDPAEASPSGMAIADGSIYVANLRGERLFQIPLDDLSTSTEHLVGEYGRLRDVALAPDGSLWVLTNNTDGRGDPRPGDDRLLSFPVR